ncbi:hypothetical protein ZHAS_00004415 [Anopheles sinensis]|uniref:Uncharacterized protein n=1 Tax=Anopheles sinensis TaxID=74873 RepID=A0A084VGW0_ANOSI|nr:hypothetical protein ZHAS_00004415 [Anopheles sinensis]
MRSASTSFAIPWTPCGVIIQFYDFTSFKKGLSSRRNPGAESESPRRVRSKPTNYPGWKLPISVPPHIRRPPFENLPENWELGQTPYEGHSIAQSAPGSNLTERRSASERGSKGTVGSM